MKVNNLKDIDCKIENTFRVPRKKHLIYHFIVHLTFKKIMTMIDIFDQKQVNELIERINKLKENQLSLWGSMNSAQMLAHCNITYQYVYEPQKFKKPNFLKLFLLKIVVKKYVVSDKPYNRNSRTAPDFIITDVRDFEKEKEILISNLEKTQKLGKEYFDGLENFSFGRMTEQEWNTMFSKHLDHHLKQFNV